MRSSTRTQAERPDQPSTRGRLWFNALSGNGANSLSSIPSLLVSQMALGDERALLLAVVPDLNNRFPFARHGQVGVLEGWHLAKQIRAAVEADSEGVKRAIVAIIDVPSQAYGRREELLGIFLAAAAATDAYVQARRVGHPVIGLIVGSAISGGFLTHGIQANRLLAFDDPTITVHAMAKTAAARVTCRTVEELDQLAKSVVPMSYRIEDYARLGTLHQLVSGVDVDSPTPDQIEQVKTYLKAAIADARAGSRDLTERYESPGARELRKATLEIRRRLAAEWRRISEEE
ncbi:MAG: biotin-independent malonate decarboxylase subunit gamma [Verrucomicrobia bacterium]|nr:biotin-independent malonate decarboxylase subunit gamma [Verrucomicrobiota bacterium]